MTIGASGPCSGCEHVRKGSSIARTAFDSSLSTAQTKLGRLQLETVKQESDQGVSAALAEGAALRSGSIRYWSRRPTIPELQFCGAEEFDGKYGCCEVKNVPEGSCADFLPRTSQNQPSSCDTCANNHRTSPLIMMHLSEILGRFTDGMKMMQEVIQPWLDAQASVEYQETVAATGILSQPPVFFPYCVAWSGPDPVTGTSRYLVGPVVNSGMRCRKWADKATAGPSAEDGELEWLWTTYKARFSKSSALFGSGWPENGAREAAEKAEVSASADVIEFCLDVLGAGDEQVDMMVTTYLREVRGYRTDGHQPQDVWIDRRTRSTQPAGNRAPLGGVIVADEPQPVASPPAPAATTALPAAQPAPASSSPGQAVSEAFEVLTETEYQHPLHSWLFLFSSSNFGQVWIGVHIGEKSPNFSTPTFAFNVAQMGSGIWTQLMIIDQPIPVQIYPQPSGTVFAAWL